MRYLVVLAIATALVACGGDNAPATATPAPPTPPTATPVVAAPTATSTLPATVTPSPIPATATATAIPTRPPGTIVAPPRAIATATPRAVPTETTAATATQPSSTATVSASPTGATPTAMTGDSEFVLLFSEEFDGDTTLPVGVSQNGAYSGVMDGFYWLESNQGRQRVSAGGSTGLTLDSGIIAVDVALDGYGAVGLFARATAATDFGMFNYYSCWLNSEGAAGCDISVNGDVYDLIGAEAGEVPVLELNALMLAVEGNEMYFIVNGVEIGPISDSSWDAGSWGIFVESYGEPFIGWFDYIILAGISPS
jgi:hypothetical protein